MNKKILPDYFLLNFIFTPRHNNTMHREYVVRYRPTGELKYTHPLFEAENCSEHRQQSTLFLHDRPAEAD